MKGRRPKPIIPIPMREVAAELRDHGKMVIVHCFYQSSGFFEEKIRIWDTTYLYDDEDEGNISFLIHCENISIAPEWTDVPPGKILNFTLYFTGLNDDCKSFTFAEIIPGSQGFFVSDIARNETDVYTIIIE